MLTPLRAHSEDTRWRLMFYSVVALDLESGAVLSKTNGRGKGGLPTYILIVKAEGGSLDKVLGQVGWEYRTFIRCYTESEALSVAQGRLKKYLSKHPKGEVTHGN